MWGFPASLQWVSSFNSEVENNRNQNHCRYQGSEGNGAPSPLYNIALSFLLGKAADLHSRHKQGSFYCVSKQSTGTFLTPKMFSKFYPFFQLPISRWLLCKWNISEWNERQVPPWMPSPQAPVFTACAYSFRRSVCEPPEARTLLWLSLLFLIFFIFSNITGSYQVSSFLQHIA